MLEKAAVISFIVIAIWATMLYGMIFGFVRNWFVKWEGEKPVYMVPKWLCKPIFECVICMTFWYGTAAYWLIWGESVKEWVIVVNSAMGITTIFANIKNTDT